MSRLIGIAAAQAMPVLNDPDASLRKLVDLSVSIVESLPWVDLICFPELFVTGMHQFVKPSLPAGADIIHPIDGALTGEFRRLAKRLGKWLVPGSFYERDGEEVYNTAVVISPEGEMVAHYRKLYPWQPMERTTPGNLGLCVFDVPELGRLGLCICYDMWFPEVSRSLAWMGAELILHPSMTSTSDRGAEMVMARANAIFNQCFFVDVNVVGAYGGGRSQFIDPEGNVLQIAGEHESVLTHVLDLDHAERTRELGTLGLSQAWKTWRDIPIEYPPYSQTPRESPMLKNLGEMGYPKNLRGR